ncbi:PREDICTED: urease accessory protein UreE [Theobroma cacao]|uniref:Urease accessory protein UreE n=1 Tax=Theobroma cacao TaxID=3641 RepID=A0AB32VFG7_THECC|nr:PREDICTED: urease accessory protein UreE [Theobroma cacao]
MARLAVAFTVIFLFTFSSHARFLTAEQEHDVTLEETETKLPESNPKTTNAIFLPSEKPGFESAEVVDFKPDDALETVSEVDSAPLTKISFRPVNRHFPRRPMIPFRHKHNCRFHKRFRPLNPRLQQKRYISYGDDMILSDEKSQFDPESRGVVRQIQPRWARFRDDGTESEDLDFIKPHHHDHDHDHDHEHEHEHDHDDHHHHHHHHHRRHHHGEEDEKDEREEHEGGFMRRFRKFFIHF